MLQIDELGEQRDFNSLVPVDELTGNAIRRLSLSIRTNLSLQLESFLVQVIERSPELLLCLGQFFEAVNGAANVIPSLVDVKSLLVLVFNLLQTGVLILLLVDEDPDVPIHDVSHADEANRDTEVAHVVDLAFAAKLFEQLVCFFKLVVSLADLSVLLLFAAFRAGFEE